MASSGELAGAASATPSSSSGAGAGAGVLGTEERSRPTTGIARREGLRGLGEELIRLDVRYQSCRPNPNKYRCSWSYLFNNIVSVADSGLNDVLHPYDDPLLLERHGEQLLNLVIRLASKQEWKSWLDTLMRIAVSTAAADIFLRLFAAHEDPVGSDTLTRLLSNAVRAGTSVEMLSAIAAAGAGRKEPSVSETVIARRGELRGLAGELVRLDMQHQSRHGGATKYRYSWSVLVCNIALGSGSGLRDAVQPREDNALLESLVEDYFDIAIRLASKREWNSWLDISTRIAVLTAATDVLPRLLAAYDDPVGDDTLAKLLDIAAEGRIVEVLPALIAAGAGPKKRSMSDADVARREGVRGLGGELARLGVQYQYFRQRRRVCFSWSRLVTNIIFVADSELHAALWPYDDAALLESHGEQLLDFFIRLASDEQWKRWVDTSAVLAASTGRTGILLRLFAAYEGPVDEAILVRLLNLAARKGHVGILSALVDAGAGAKVQEVDEVRWPETALHLAARAGHRTFVAKLIEAGASVDTRHNQGGTALTDAVEGGHTGVALELLAAGADVDNKKEKMLDDRGAEVTRWFGNFTPLGISVSKNDEDMAKVLLEAGANPIAGQTDNPPLHIAARQGGFEIANHLILAGASVSSVDTKGRTALHIACAYNQQDVVELLLRHNSKAALTCNNGQTPMDVVGAQALALRQKGDFYSRMQSHPSTLNSTETSTVDIICGMLQSAAAWGRRGWLVLMRSRPLAELVDQSTPRDADDISLSVGSIHLADEPCMNTVGVQREEGGGTPHLHDGGNASADCGAVVVWLLQSPDECLFRNIVQFL